MFCTGCGAQLPDGNKFCTQCGKPVAEVASAPAVAPQPIAEPTPVAAPQPAAASGTVACPACGAQVTAGFAFCTQCGSNIATSSPAPASPYQLVGQPIAVQAPPVQQSAPVQQPVAPATQTVPVYQPSTSSASLGYDETVVLQDIPEDSLDTVVQPDPTEDFEETMGSYGGASTSPAIGRHAAQPEPQTMPVDVFAAPTVNPVISANPPQADDSDTVVLYEDPEPAPPAQPTLKLTRANGDVCVLSSFPVTVGKGSEADLIIGDNSAISRVHVRILRDGNTFAAEDLNSTNKTFIGDYELPPLTPTILSDGDTLRLGNEVLEVGLA